MLPEVERLLTKTDDYESLWRSAWEKIATAIESFERGTSTVTEFHNPDFSLVTLAPEVFSSSGFNPTRHAAPYTAISRYAKGQIFVIATPLKGGWSYRIDYPYYSWAETVVRPRISRRSFSRFLTQVNELERDSEGMWKLDNSEMTSAIKFLGSEGTLAASTLAPDDVIRILRAELISDEAKVAAH